MVTSFAGVQTDLSKVVHSSCRSFCHSSEPHSFFVCISGARPTSLRYRCSEHKLVGSHCVCLRSQGCPLQGDPKLQAAQLPDHCNSPRLAGDALVLGPSAALNRDPSPVTSVNNSIPVRLPVSTTISHPGVPQQSTAAEPTRLESRSGQLQRQGFSLNCCPSKTINKVHLPIKVGRF